MDTVIFEMDSVPLKAYLKSRFKIDKPYIYVVGKELKLPVDISAFNLAISNSMVCEYTMGTEDKQTVEYLKFDNFTLGLYSDLSPMEIMSKEELKNVLRIGLFEKIDKNDRVLIYHALSEFGFKVNKNKISKRTYPYSLSKNQSYLVVKYPLFFQEKELSEDLEVMERIFYSITLKEKECASIIV
jgi:hypothetical protein